MKMKFSKPHLREFATRAVLLGFSMTQEGFNHEWISENAAPTKLPVSIEEEKEYLIEKMKIPQFVTLLEEALEQLGCAK